MRRNGVCERVMRAAGVRGILAVWGMVFVATSAVAQHTDTGRFAIGNAQERQVAEESRVLPARTVTVTLEKVALAKAVDLIAEKANVRIQYRANMLDRVVVPVSVKVVDASLESVLEKLLVGTGLYAIRSADDAVTIKARESEQRAVQGTVVGTVISAKTKQPVSGATITLNDAQKGVVTNDNGEFRISVATGEHTLRVKGIGFTRHSQQIAIEDGATVMVEVVLEASASVLDEVIVTGTVVETERKAIPTPITVITGDELERRGITRIEQLFRGEVPGLLVIERGAATYANNDVGQGVSSTIYSRGSTDLYGGANPIKTYIDGVELLDPSYLGTIDPRSIERIEIVTGPQAATIYGSGAMGGVMQIFTRKGDYTKAPDIAVTVKYGMLQNSFSKGLSPEHHDVLAVNGSSGKNLSYSGTLSYDYSGQWQPGLYNRRFGGSLGARHMVGPLTVASSFSSTVSSQGTWNVFDDAYGILELLTGPEGKVEPWMGNVAAQYTSKQISTTSNMIASINVDYQATSIWQHHLTAGRSQNAFLLKPVGPNFTTIGDSLWKTKRMNGQRITWGYNTSVVSQHSWLSSSLTLGVNGSRGDKTSVDGCLVSKIGSSLEGCRSGAGVGVQLPLNDQSWGGFGSWQIGLFRHLYGTLGLRMEKNPDYGHRVQWDVTPTHGLSYVAEIGMLSLKLMGSYGRATRPPQPYQRLEAITISPTTNPAQWIGTFANPELRPEYSRGPQGGIELYYGNRWAVTINHYKQTVSDLIQGIPTDSVLVERSAGSVRWVPQYQYRNAAQMRQIGWEGTGSMNIGPFVIKSVYSWADSRVIAVNDATGTSDLIGQAINGLPTHAGNITASYAYGKANMSLSANYVGDGSVNRALSREARLSSQARHSMYQSLNPNGFSVYMHQEGYTRSDFTGAYQVLPQLTLTVNVINLGNQFNSDIGNLNPTLGRQTTIGFAYRL